MSQYVAKIYSRGLVLKLCIYLRSSVQQLMNFIAISI